MTSGKHAIAVLAAACAAAAGFSGPLAAQNPDPAQPRLVWAAKPVPATNERWHRASFHGTGMATRLAITPRNKEGQVHYWQPDVREDAPSGVRPLRR